MAKITKEEASKLLESAEDHFDGIDYTLTQLPNTPGREQAEQGLKEVWKGLEQIRKEQEGGT